MKSNDGRRNAAVPGSAAPLPTAIPSTWTAPGLVDLQVNGYAGFDFNSHPDSWTVAEWIRVRDRLLRRGVVAALPAFITDAPDALRARVRRYGSLIREEPALAEMFPRLHIEGPFLCPEDGPRGAHPRRHCATPNTLPDLIDSLRELSGNRLGIVTVAPELPGALNLIARLSRESICPAIGHTAASAACLTEAVDAGARMSTHLGNGSHQQLPRLDNYIQAQLAEDQLAASFIADGHHLPFFTLKNFLRAKGLERSVLITDAMAAAEVGPGRYDLCGMEVVVTEELYVSKPGEPNLAGSALTLDRAVVNVVTHCGVSFPDAWAMASTRPAILVGLPLPCQVTVQVSPEGFSLVPS